MLPDRHSLLDEEIQILWKVWCQSVRLEDPQNLASCDVADQRNAEAVAQGHADLRRRQALLGELANVVAHVVGLHLDPCRGLATVGDRRGGDTLALAIHAAHGFLFLLLRPAAGVLGTSRLRAKSL